MFKTGQGNPRNWEVIDGTVFGYSGNVLQAEPASLTDWQDEVLQVGKSTNFGASVSGGSEKGDYYISAGFNDQAGLVKNSGFKSIAKLKYFSEFSRSS